MKDRIKFAYLTYQDMLSRINSGNINEYDIIYSKDRYVTYLITEDLQPLEIRSRVYTYNSVSEAIEKLNTATDTYIGQIVSILVDDTYRGYIVNEKNNAFIVTPLWENPDPIDYNTLGNRPIINLVGTLDDPIMVSELSDGIYNIKGQYKISNLEETVYLSVNDIICTVSIKSDGIAVKHITSDEITDYFITSSGMVKNKYVTEQYLEKYNYITTSYVDTKIDALELSIKNEVQDYVKQTVNDMFNDKLDEKIDEKIKENIESIEDNQIVTLF